MDRKERRERSKARKAERFAHKNPKSKYYKEAANPLGVKRYLIHNEHSHMKRPLYNKTTEGMTALMPEIQRLENRTMVPSWTWDDAKAWTNDTRALVAKKVEMSIQAGALGSGFGEAHDQQRLEQYAQAVLKPRAFEKKQRAIEERTPVLEHSYDQMREAQMAFSDRFEAMMNRPMPEIQFGP